MEQDERIESMEQNKGTELSDNDLQEVNGGNFNTSNGLEVGGAVIAGGLGVSAAGIYAAHKTKQAASRAITQIQVDTVKGSLPLIRR